MKYIPLMFTGLLVLVLLIALIDNAIFHIRKNKIKKF